MNKFLLLHLTYFSFFTMDVLSQATDHDLVVLGRHEDSPQIELCKGVCRVCGVVMIMMSGTRVASCRERLGPHPPHSTRTVMPTDASSTVILALPSLEVILADARSTVLDWNHPKYSPTVSHGLKQWHGSDPQTDPLMTDSRECSRVTVKKRNEYKNAKTRVEIV